MKKHLGTVAVALAVALVVVGASQFTKSGISVGGFSDPFISLQLAASPVADYILSSDGTNNSWIVNSGGSSAFSWTPTTWGVSTSTTLGFLNGFLSAASSTISGVLHATGGVTGALTGNADTATALAANGANCGAGNYPLGVDASGAVEDCTAAGSGSVFAWTPSTTYNENTSATTTPLWLQDTLYASSTSFFTGNSTFFGSLTATLTGNADTATALAANGTNASAGNAILGVDASGNAEGAFDVWTEAENTSAGYTTNTGTVTSVAQTVPTGLTISGSPVTTTGTLAIAYDTGYSSAGLLTASTTNWNSFYDTPSGRISAGTGLSWSTNTLNAEVQTSDLHDAVTVSGTPNYITLVGQDIVRAKLDISDDTNLTGGTGLTLTANDLAVDASQTQITAVGTLLATTTATNLHVTGDLQVDGVFFAPIALTAGGDLAMGGFNITNVGTITATNGSFTNATTTSFGINSETFTDLTGTGLTNVGGVLTSHAAVTVSGTPNYITLSGQDLVRAKLDITDDTNLIGGTNITLSTNTLNVDDAFLINSGDDTTSGQLTATNFIGSSSATSTLTGGLAAFAFNQTGTATSTFAQGLDLANGCFAVNGTCVGGTGTVTSVNASGGTTGFSFTGGPVTTSGTLTLTGTLGVANGGTGATTIGGTNRVLYTSSVDTLASTANFSFDGTNFGVGTSTPDAPITAQAADNNTFLNFTAAGLARFKVGTDASGNVLLYTGNSVDLRLGSTSAPTQLIIKGDSGKVGLGTTTPSEQLSITQNLFVGNSAVTTLGQATSSFQGDIRIYGKLDVGTIDPIYTIDGTKYATYGHSTIGIKEEVVEKFILSQYDEERGLYKYEINFSELEKESDLWLFYQITEFGDGWKDLVTTASPSFDGKVFFEERPDTDTLVVWADNSGKVSVRLIANRFDYEKWPNLRPDQYNDFTHFKLKSK